MPRFPNSRTREISPAPRRLKGFRICLSVLVAVLAAACASSPPGGPGGGAAPGEYKIGQLGPGGGLVFFDKGEYADGWRYLEAAPRDLKLGRGIRWNKDELLAIKTDTSVGSGKANTDLIIAAQGDGAYAAKLCKDLVVGGLRDWFLPSKDELDLMFTNLKSAGVGGFKDGWYWSSSQIYWSYFAWYENFEVGFQGSSYKTAEYSVRACREF